MPEGSWLLDLTDESGGGGGTKPKQQKKEETKEAAVRKMMFFPKEHVLVEKGQKAYKAHLDK
eukprot:5984037-Pyramimonas_sp.AAC.1